MPVGLGLFGLVAMVSIIGSVVPAWAATLYGSWWFVALLGALVLNTGLCTIRQAIPAWTGPARLKALFLVHGSVVVIAVGCLGGTLAFQTTTVSVHPGDVFSVGAQVWTVKGIVVERYPDGSVSDWVTTVETPDGTQSIRVNHPAEVGDDKVLQSGYGRDYTVHLEFEGRSRDFALSQDTEFPLTDDGHVGLALSPPRDGLVAAAQDDPDQQRIVEVLLTSGGRILQSTMAFEGLPLLLGDTGLAITVQASVQRSSLLIRHTPGLWLVWTGLALMAFSITALMLLPRTRKETPHA